MPNYCQIKRSKLQFFSADAVFQVILSIVIIDRAPTIFYNICSLSAILKLYLSLGSMAHRCFRLVFAERQSIYKHKQKTPYLLNSQLFPPPCLFSDWLEERIIYANTGHVDIELFKVYLVSRQSIDKEHRFKINIMIFQDCIYGI